MFTVLYLAFSLKVYKYLAKQQPVFTVLYLAFSLNVYKYLAKQLQVFTVLYLAFNLKVYKYLAKQQPVFWYIWLCGVTTHSWTEEDLCGRTKTAPLNLDFDFTLTGFCCI